MSLQQSRPIGIFDSGIGGLTVFQEIARNKGIGLDGPAVSLSAIKDDFRAVIKNIFAAAKSGNDFSGKKDDELSNNYRRAMEAEQRSHQFYREIYESAADKNIKLIAEAFAFEENEHYEILQDTLTYLDKPGDWFREQEHWIVEG